MKKKEKNIAFVKIVHKWWLRRNKGKVYLKSYSEPCLMEFGFEIANIIPKIFYYYKTWCITATHSLEGMRPFYFFSKDHREYDNQSRSDIENDAYLHTSWRWDKKMIFPNYKKHYKNDIFVFKKPLVIIYNKYTDEWKWKPINFIDVTTLVQICEILNKDFQIIYIRPHAHNVKKGYSEDNQRFHDLNEHGILKEKFPEIIFFEELMQQYPQYTFNEIQLMICANCKNFISVQWGGSRLCSYFWWKNIIYHRHWKELSTYQYRDFYPKFSWARIIVSQNLWELKSNIYIYIMKNISLRLKLRKLICLRIYQCINFFRRIYRIMLLLRKRYISKSHFIKKMYWLRLSLQDSLQRFYWRVIAMLKMWRGDNLWKVVVYSCVTGKYDDVYDTILKSHPFYEKNTYFVLFTDTIPPWNIQVEKIVWQIRPLEWQNKDDCRRTARWHKTHSHVLFPDADYTVWLDGTQVIRRIFISHDLVARNIWNKNIATFRHPVRICIYKEAEKCIEIKKDTPYLIKRQMQWYKKEGYPVNNWLAETTCVIRKNTPEMTNFNISWWNQIRKHSFRDQLSFDYLIWKTQLEYNIIPGWRTRSVYFLYVSHNKKM